MKSTAKLTKRRNTILKNFKIEKENLKIYKPSADDYKVPIYTVKLSEHHFIS
jgi:hypothetical protein